MVIIAKQEVATVPYRYSSNQDDTVAIIYELQEIELIPFEDISLRTSENDSPGVFSPQSLEF
jgi:hypothetical protein